MKDRTLKLSALGIFIVAALAAICAVVVFMAVMLIASLADGRPEPGLEWRAPQENGGLATPAGVRSGPGIVPARVNTTTLATALPSVTSSSPDVVATTVITHVVQSGENLFRISRAYGVTVPDIMAANGIVDARFLSAGQLLRIPVGRAVAPPAGMTAGTAASDELSAANPAAGLAPATATADPPAPTATSTPWPRIGVNDLAIESIVVLPEDVRQNVRQIFARGQELGRNPAAYSKLGDSTIENPYFMARFDDGPFVLGDYAFLEETIDYFAGSHGRQGVGVRRGFHSWTVTDPLWADKSVCLPNENSVACEIRLHNPSIMLIRLGSNDSGVPAGFEQNMRLVVDIAIQSGVIPVLGTKADRFEGSNVNNEIIRRLAGEYRLPLWDFDLVAGTIPGRGLDVDGVHLTTFYAHDYTSPTAFQRGHSMHNLTALMALDVMLREVIRDSG